MITLKAPVELKTRTDFITDHDSFGERIAGNYALMGLEIGAEELLHMVNSPPEIYIAEGDATTIVGNTLISSRNEEKLDIINNMLNRIMLSVNTELSYQDRAYITDALYKIGIKDDRKFMSEVRKLMSESRLEEDFINDYLAVRYDSRNEELKQETLELSRQIVQQGLAEGLRPREETLSRQIMHRLQTGAIYQIVANFNKSLNETRIDIAEQLISEQENVAKRMLVQSFLETMEREGAEIIYREEQGAEAEETPGSTQEIRVRELLSESSTLRESSASSETERLLREREELSRLTVTEREGAEIIYREEGASPAEGQEETGIPIRPAEGQPGIETERDRELLSELRDTIRERTDQTVTETIMRENADIIYREGTSPAGEEEIREYVTERIRESGLEKYQNIYERELKSESISETEISGTINAAVLLDIVKNLYHAGYERITNNDAWIEYRGALYHSSENTINRISSEAVNNLSFAGITELNADYSALSLDYTEFEELSEIQENEGNIELIENQIREINESNMRNVSRYEQMIETLKKLEPERRASGGRERTRREALMALEDERAILQSLEEGEGEQEQRRREVFQEIIRLFPDSAAQVYNVVEQYLSNPASLQGVNLIQGNVAQAAEEIMKLQQANERAAEEIPEVPEIPVESLIHKREERLSQEELTEILDSYRSSTNRQMREDRSNEDITETRNINSTTVVNNTERTLSARELDNIEDMVNRGVRSQMGAISEQVLNKLEKRLRNEKSRRGL